MILGFLCGLPFKWVFLRRLEGEAPMQVDPAKPCRLLQEREPVVYKRFGHWIAVFLLARNIEA